MTDTSTTSTQLAQAIQILQDAIHKEAINKKLVRADIVSAANILLGLLGIPSVAPDPGDGH